MTERSAIVPEQGLVVESDSPVNAQLVTLLGELQQLAAAGRMTGVSVTWADENGNPSSCFHPGDRPVTTYIISTALDVLKHRITSGLVAEGNRRLMHAEKTATDGTA